MEGITDQFLYWLEVEKRCSPLTVEAYGRDLRQFVDWLCPADSGAFDPPSVTPSDVRAWLGSLADEGLAAVSMRRKVQSIRSFYHWGMKTGRFERNPAADVTLPRRRKKLPEIIRQKDIEGILDVKADDYRSARARFVLTMLYSLGLRQAELLALDDDDIDLSAREVKVTGKRSKQRVLPLPEELCDEIRDWRQARDARWPDLSAPRPLLPGPEGRLSRQKLYDVVHEALTGVPSGRRSPHTLRHTFATAMVGNGADLDAVREMLGHATLSTTQIYTHLSVSELMAGYRHAHPRAAKKNEDS